MNRIIPLALLLFFSFSLLGYYPVFLVLRYEARQDIRKMIKNGLPDEELVCFELGQNEYDALEWKEKNEFRFNGQMFDVVREKQSINGTILLFCISDVKESTLLCELDDQVSEMSAKSQSARNKPDILKSLSIFFIHGSYHGSVITADSVILTDSPQAIYYSQFFEVYSPPPEIIC